ncbi:hypothetical protein ECC02_002888 [Trypanosoma cruzi]|uniref:Tubulin-tyrosine ligase-like protein n=1 Tax=Trypanosoma cruzi TaxID=5693 RepID=A0A7J6YBT7_TRYCR|nr:hypothetical protein ECC02_002888 [Trypanosoma cruzi]
MAEQVIVEQRKGMLATCLVSSEISSPLLAPEDAPVNGGRAPLSAAVVNLHKTNQAVAPVSVVPLRWRASSHVRPQQDAEAECEEPDADGSHLTVVTQRGPIHKASGDCYKQVSPSVGAVRPNMSARVTGPYFSGGKSENAGRPGTNAALSQRPWSLSQPRIDNTLQRPNERSSSETQNGDRVSARRKLRRRHSSNVQGNNNTNNLAKLDGSTENKPNSSPPGAVDGVRSAAGLNGSLIPVRLTDLERPFAKQGQVSVRSKQSGAKSARIRQKIVNLSLCKYSLLRVIAEEQGFKTQETEEELEKNQFNLIWSDTVLPLTRLVRMASWQRTNHFPSMYLLCRKGHLGITLGKMRKLLPSHFLFYPRTWSLRSDRHQFSRFMMALRAKRVSKFFILKPNSGCQGRGIVISRDPLNAVEDLDNYIVQEYVTRPLLLEGRKFDLRVYVLLTSIRAPSIFMFKDGLVRLCAELYEKPTDSNARNACKHLTNYAVNKHNPEYVFNDDVANGNVGNKRNFKFLNEWLESSGKRPEDFWEAVAHLICKTILVAQPQIANVYNSCFPRQNDGYNCFELLGFDILIDHKMKPWLMEVNHTPSFCTDTPLDYEIKHSLVKEVWSIIDVKATDKKYVEKKEREGFMQRVMRQPIAAQNVTGVKGADGNDTASSSSMPATVYPQQQQQQISNIIASLPVGTQDQAMEMVKLIEERRAREDSKLCNFQRIYPTTNAAHQLIYEAILAQARTQCVSPRPAWVSSPTPASPQAIEERSRRFDASSVGFATPQRITPAVMSVRDRSNLPTPSESATDSLNLPSNSSTLSRGQQMQKLCEEMRQTQRHAKTTPRTAHVINHTLQNNGGAGNENQHSTDVPLNSPSSAEKATNSLAQERKRPVLARLSVMGDAEGPSRKLHVITARLTPCGPPNVISLDSSDTNTGRIEAMRSLQERLDQEAECEHSPSSGSADENSFGLDEE